MYYFTWQAGSKGAVDGAPAAPPNRARFHKPMSLRHVACIKRILSLFLSVTDMEELILYRLEAMWTKLAKLPMESQRHHTDIYTGLRTARSCLAIKILFLCLSASDNPRKHITIVDTGSEHLQHVWIWYQFGLYRLQEEWPQTGKSTQ